ncbi:fimbrial biogenesis chaperone [Serratia aquatilis]|uniref:Molecular chaperone n=1 Tax=Serratia aquatilis TaxID=1737515 RepID=A0ABV6EH79_9GAMM
MDVSRLIPLLCAGLLISEASPAAEPMALGGISLSKTRVIFAPSTKAQTFAVSNSGKQSYLIQSRVQRTPDDTTQAPFIVVPPLFRLQPDSLQQIRIVSQGAMLPKDRESLFYLSVLAIPAGSEQRVQPMQVSMGIRFVLKLFYRPSGLVSLSQCSLRFHRVAQGVKVENPTPYFQTLGNLAFNHNPVNLDKQPAMLAPQSEQIYPVSAKERDVNWQTVTDYGGLSPSCQQRLISQQNMP